MTYFVGIDRGNSGFCQNLQDSFTLEMTGSPWTNRELRWYERWWK